MGDHKINIKTEVKETIDNFCQDIELIEGEKLADNQKLQEYLNSVVPKGYDASFNVLITVINTTKVGK